MRLDGSDIVDVLPIVVPSGGGNDDDNNGVDSAKGGRWMWHGGAVAEMTLPHGTATMYCPPSNADRVLKV